MMKPQLKLNLAGLPEPEVKGIALVFRKDGSPALDEDFVRNLSPKDRVGVEHALAVHGFKLDGNKVTEI